MKLPLPETRNLAENLAEFDIWITPSLGEIRDTDRFRRELGKVVELFDALAAATNSFKSLATCSPDAITRALRELIKGRSEEAAIETLKAAASLLFLVTGKSDNNAKCQLPLHIRDSAKWITFPIIRRLRNGPILKAGSLPRVLKADDYMDLTGRLSQHPEDQERLLREFVQFILSDEQYVAQLWSIGHSYASLKAFHQEKSLLTPLVIFQVRGSVSATGGHAPEGLLRARFVEWGLLAGSDFNTSDVVLSALPGSSGRVKTRAYDFVLPFAVEGWKQRVFVQSQFYAGDSGSVSHKNVDQTSTSRRTVLERIPNAKFVEYVDGAGYFSSLNGDLKTLLAMSDTASFFQVRSAPIRLRRVLQEIGFLTPLEIEHAIARTNGSGNAIKKILRQEGYEEVEIARSLETSCDTGIIAKNGSRYEILDGRRSISRRYFIVDMIARNGFVPDVSEGAPAGFLLVPGYGPLFGMKLVEVLRATKRTATEFADELNSSETFVSDIQWLEEQKWVISS